MKRLCKLATTTLFGALLILQSPMATEGDTNQVTEQKQSSHVIYKVDSFSALKSQIDSMDEKACRETLLISDVNYTLIQPIHPAFQKGNFALSFDFIDQCKGKVPESMKHEFASFIAVFDDGELIEGDVPGIIDGFEQKGVRVVLMSGLITGKIAHIPNTMDWITDNLKRLGIKPTPFGGEKTHQFKQLPAYKGEYPEIREGVILTNGSKVKKNKVLEAFLSELEWTPKTIIFIDDKRELVDQIGECAQAKGVDFIGYEYEGAKHSSSKDSISKEDLESTWTDLMEAVL